MYEALEMHMINSDYFDVRNNLETRIIYLIEQYGSLRKFEDDLIKIRLGLDKIQSQFQIILGIVGKNYPKEAKELFTRIQENNPKLIPESTELIRNNYKDEKYYYNILNWLWERKDIKDIYINTFFWLLSWGRNRDRKYYKVSDLDYYEYGIKNLNTLHIADSISYNLIAYAYIDKGRTFGLLDMFIKAPHEKELDHLNYTIFDNKETYSVDFKNEIKILFYKNIDKIDLENSRGEMFFEFLETNFGFEELFKFIESLLETLLKKDEYAYVNLTRYYYKGKSSLKDQISRYVKILDWYIVNNDSNPKKCDFILNMFRPDVKLTEDIKNAIIPLINKYHSNSNNLILIAKSLQQFANTNEEWITTLCSIGDKIIVIEDFEFDFSKIFGSSFYYNNGSKTKAGMGIPYNEDVLRKLLLEKIISERNSSDRVTEYLNKCLSKVNQDIDNAIKEDEENLGWK